MMNRKGSLAFSLTLALVLQMGVGSVLAQPPAGPPGAAPTPPVRKGPLLAPTMAQSLRGGSMTMNYENIDLKVLARLMSELTGRNILLDDRVAGRITVLSSREVTADEAFSLFRAALDRYGFQLVEKRGFYVVMPSPDVRRDGRLRLNPRNLKGDEFTVGLIITKNTDVTVLQNALRPLLADPNGIQAIPGGRALIVVDKASTVAKVAELARQLDKAIPQTRVAVVIPLHAEADKLATMLTSVLARQTPVPGDPAPAKITAFVPTNAVLIQGTDRQIKEAKTVIARLDIPRSAPHQIEKPQFYVRFLQYAQAEETAKILGDMLSERKTQQQAQQNLDPQALLRATADASSYPSAGVAGPAVRAPSDPGAYPKLADVTGSGTETRHIAYVSAKVAADLDTNSVILFLSPKEYEEVEAIISELDVPRKQVLVLAMVAEVTLDKVLDTGAKLQMATPGGVLSAYNAGLTQEGLLSALAGGNFAIGQIGSNSQTISVSGQNVSVPTFFSFLTGNKNDSNFNLISSPRLLTADHKEAKMEVGNVVPFPTGVRFDNNNQPLVTYDYKDVGIKLKFTPHVSQSNQIRLDLEQEVQEVTSYLQQSQGGTGYSIPLISNRSVKTFATLKEGETLLIGGLIAKKTIDNVSKVPILGDIPLINNFFTTRHKDDQKTTLFISLTPYIINHPDEVARLDRSYQEFMAGQPTPRDAQHEPRNTQASRHVVTDPYAAAAAKPDLPPAGAVRLSSFAIRPPEGTDNLRQARLQVSNQHSGPVEMVLVGQVRLPSGETREFSTTPVRLMAGEQREVALPPYKFPDVLGDYDFDVRAVMGEEVIARLPLATRLEVKSLAPAPGTGRAIR